MKKIIKSLILILIPIFFINCSTTGAKFIENFIGEKVFGFTEREEFLNKLKAYKLEAIIKTTKGDMKVYLYPEAAPTLVANFVFLSQNDYYDNIDFHRVNVNNIIQAGDRSPNHDGTGTPGYLLPDEFSFLKFDRAGVLAMANSGKDTNGSQIFITLQKVDAYNDNYSIIGNLIDTDDLSVARLIRQDDKILDVVIKGYNVENFLDNFKKETTEWSEKLKETGFKLKEDK